LFLNRAGKGEAKDRERDGGNVGKERSRAQRKLGMEAFHWKRGRYGRRGAAKDSRGGRPSLLAKEGRETPLRRLAGGRRETWKVEDEDEGTR
jgi:hypothetical protein